MSEFDRVAAEFKQYVVMQTVAEEILFDVVPAVIQSVWGDMVFRLKANILTDSLPPETVTESVRVVYDIPASTWQMWKKRHAHAWYARRLVARWPVQYEKDPDGRYEVATCTFSLERFRAYPESRLKASDHGRMVMLYDARSDWTTEEGS